MSEQGHRLIEGSIVEGVKIGAIAAEGKTKILYQIPDSPDQVLVQSKEDITAWDDPSKTQHFGSKAEYATATTCRVFELLRDCGVATAYVQQVSPTMFIMLRSEMLSLEVVTRRLAVGSFLMRNCHLVPADPKKPHRFHRLKFELFLKTTGKVWRENQLPCDDPLILDPYALEWELHHPKRPLYTPGEKKTVRATPLLTIDPKTVLPEGITVAEIERRMRIASLVIEKAWALLGITWNDIKLEFDNALNVSDVVDNDSWRITDQGENLDKEVFRQGGAAVLDEVEEKYGRVARLAQRFRVPRQALVLWRASDKDAEFESVPNIPGVEVIQQVGSLHRKTVSSLEQCEGIFRDYPDGGVIVVKVGRSNGAGPVLAAHSPWPVITVPENYKDFPNDVHSSVRLPSSGVPCFTTWPVQNAIDGAVRLLGATNPAAYAHNQYALEEQDDYIS